MTKKEALQLFEEKKIRSVWDDKEEKWYFSIKPHKILCMSALSPNAQNSRISHQRFCCALSS